MSDYYTPPEVIEALLNIIGGGQILDAPTALGKTQPAVELCRLLASNPPFVGLRRGDRIVYRNAHGQTIYRIAGRRCVQT